MKKIFCSLTLLLCLVLTACSASEKYPFEYVGLYNTQIRQPIKIGMSKADVEKMIGRGELNADYTQFKSYKYGDGLYVDYAEDVVCNIDFFDPWGDIYHPEKRLYYELPGNINVQSTVTDFIDTYTNVYEYTDNLTSRTTMSVFVENVNSEYIVLSKKDLIDAKEHLDKHGNIYQIEIDYSSYDSISSLHIRTVMPDLKDWDKVLQEVNK